MTATEPGRRRLADIIIGVLGIVVVIWGAYWYLANQLTEMGLRRALAMVATDGRSAKCTPSVYGRSPFRLDVGCSGVSLADAGRAMALDVRGLTVSAPLFPPFSAEVAVLSPGSLTDASSKAEARWADARVAARAGWGGLTAASLDVKDADLTGGLLARFDLAGAALSAARLSIAPAKENAYLVSGAIDGLAPKAKAGEALPPIGVVLNLTAKDAGSALGIDPRRALHRWVANGGQARLDELSISAGGFSAKAEGDLTVSADGLLSGKVTLRIKGLAALPDLAEAYRPGSREDAERARKILTVVTRDARDPAGDVRTTSLNLRNGVVSFGLLPLTVLPPLF
jgi:hypothetical protein